MKVAILAADQVKNWPRHQTKIHDETIVERTVRMLRERGVEDIWVSHAPEPGVRYQSRTNDDGPFGRIVNFETGNDLGCIYGIKDFGFDLFLFGDVFFTDDALDTIIAGKVNFYARTKAGKVKNYGEMFAMKPDEKFWKVLDRMWEEYKIMKTRRRLWSWDLYSEIMGKDFYKHRNVGNMEEISDETEDFDKPEDLEKWREKNAVKIEREGKVLKERKEDRSKKPEGKNRQ